MPYRTARHRARQAGAAAAVVGSEVLEAATDYDGDVCRLYYATNDA
ncbi:hypothetical protein ACFT8W_18430 [Streptomyces hygroscopicus]